MAAFARGLGVFPQMAMWGASIYNLIGIKTESPFYPITSPILDVQSMISFGIILGVLGIALMAEEFKIRSNSWRGYAQCL